MKFKLPCHRSKPTPVHRAAFTPLFVAGSPRSGTTILHAMICSSDKANRFINECSYFTAFMHPLQVGLNTYEAHTRHYFESREALIAHHATVLQGVLDKIWMRAGSPEVLALKDPMMTPLIPLVAQALPNAKFVVSIRDPRATVSSRIDVAEREHPNKPVTYEEVLQFCIEYTRMYRVIADARTTLGKRLCLVDHRDVATGNALLRLNDFGIGKLDASRIWSEPISDPTAYANDVWSTSLHGKPPSTASIHRFRERLAPSHETLIMQICGPVARELDAIQPGFEQLADA